LQRVTHDPELDTIDEPAVGVCAFVQGVLRRAPADGAVLAGTVGAEGHDPVLVGPLDYARRHAGAADPVLTQARQVDLVGQVEQRRQEKWSPTCCGNSVLVDETGCRSGIPGVHHHVRHSLEQHAEQPQGARDMAGGERREDDAVAADAGQARAQLREQSGVGVLDPFRLPGRA
jgi:hypothetical protein